MRFNKTLFRVRYSETDAMRHAHHSHHLHWFEQGRTEFLRERGYPYRSLEEKNCFLPVVEIGCRYIWPARYDDLLEVETQLEEITNAKIRFSYRIKKMEENQIIATGFTVHACTDEKGSPTRVPSMIKELIKDHDEVKNNTP